MSTNKLRSLDLIQADGGLSTKQGDTWSRIAYQLVDENEESIRVDDAEKVTVYLKNENGLYQLNGILEGDEVGFYLTPQVTNGSYQVEIQIQHITGRVSKFPSTNTVTLKVVKSLVNQEGLTITILDNSRNNNLPEDPETGEKVLVGGDNSIGWYQHHNGTYEILLTSNISEGRNLYSDFPEIIETDYIGNPIKENYVRVVAYDYPTKGYIHNEAPRNNHGISIDVGQFKLDEPQVLSIPLTDMSTGSSKTFNIKVYPYSWYDPETKTIRKPVEETEEPSTSSDHDTTSETIPGNLTSENDSTTIDLDSGTITIGGNVSDATHETVPEENEPTQPVIDEDELIRLEEEELKLEGYRILRNKITNSKEYQSTDTMETFTLAVDNGVVVRRYSHPSDEEYYEQLWPVIERIPLVSELGNVIDIIFPHDSVFEEVRAVDVNNVMREDEQFLCVINGEELSELQGDEFSGNDLQEYTFNMFKEYVERGVKTDPDGQKYPIFYFVAELNGTKYYVEGE